MFATMHRKSAVELLQESKASYVKSEIVLDRKQELRHSKHLQVSSAPIILHSPTLVLRKSPSTELWRRGTQDNESGHQILGFFPVSNPQFYASTTSRRKHKPLPSPMDEEQLLVEQLARALRREQAQQKTCTCHVVFKKAVKPQPTPPPERHHPPPPARFNSKSPKRESRQSRHRSDSASRDQLQIKLRRLLWDDENEEPPSFGVTNSQQHKSMPDLRAPNQGSDYRKTLNSPGLSLRSEDGLEEHSVSPAFTVPEIAWRFFDDEPLCLRAPEGFRDKDTDDAFESTCGRNYENGASQDVIAPLDAPTSAMLDRFFRHLGQPDDTLSVLSVSSSPVFFESVGSAETPHSSDGTDPPRFAGLTSVVERNARIIKWLCNCRKAGLPAACMPS